MEILYKDFYRNFYLNTNGFIPSKPFNQNMYPGDFFQIRNGAIIVLGNIFSKGIIDRDECDFEYGLKLNTADWSFNLGLTKPYSGRGSGHSALNGEFEFSKQILAFGSKGNFFFKGNQPESVKIKNWNDIKQQLIIKMTQTFYSFREIYIVTESAVAADWTLAISSSSKGELEIATDAENFGLVDIFGHHAARTIQSKDIEYYHREANKKPAFFKAKKLAVTQERLEVFMSELINERQDQSQWVKDFYEYDFHHDPTHTTTISNHAKGSILDMLRANELNANTALEYFTWTDANLDDIEKLFLSYGN